MDEQAISSNVGRKHEIQGDSNLRYWPAFLILAIYWLLVLSLKPFGGFVAFMGLLLPPFLSFLLFLVWWTTLSRGRWFERVFISMLVIVGIVLANLAAHKYLVGIAFVMYVLPWFLMEWAIVAWVARAFSPGLRLVIVGVVLAAFLAATTALRFEGMDGDMNAKFSPRWSPSAEDRFVSVLRSQPNIGDPKSLTESTSLAISSEDWPQFRGPNRDSRVTVTGLSDNWTKDAPRLVWKKPIGPGWSSFSIVGPFLFTQEQRGEMEVIACYKTEDGSQVWAFEDKARFEEAVAGAGPRATPTIHDGRLYAMGATGNAICLDPVTGKLIWKRNLVEDTAAAVPMWGFASSPLVIDNKVAFIACGPKGKSVIAYDASTGEPAWTAGEGIQSYSSAEAFHLGGVPQVLSTTEYGIQSFDARDGKLVWEYAWKSSSGQRMLQPLVIDDHQILVQTYLDGIRLIDVSHNEDQWSISTLWESKDLKSYFNDCVVHKGFVYGFDGNIFTCIDLKTGKRAWKKGRYGYGQVALLSSIDRLLVLSETGQAVLLNASSTAHEEFGQFQAIEGKTWNHPVIVRDKLFVRNGEEMACYQIPKL